MRPLNNTRGRHAHLAKRKVILIKGVRIEEQFKFNEQIQANEVILIDDQGEKLGRMSWDQAMYLAQNKNLDLIEVGSSASPPVVKIMDWGKFRYEREKKIKKQKAHSKTKEVKEVRISLKIEQHDFETKIKKAKQFLEKGHPVRISLFLKGRENMFVHQGEEQIKTFVRELQAKPIGPLEKNRNILSILVNKK